MMESASERARSAKRVLAAAAAALVGGALVLLAFRGEALLTDLAAAGRLMLCL